RSGARSGLRGSESHILISQLINGLGSLPISRKRRKIMDTKSLRHRSFLRYLLAAIAVVAFTAVTASAARFGTMCQENYQNGWQHTLPYVWERCAYFNNEL